MTPHTRINSLELPHFPHVRSVEAPIHEWIAVATYVVAGHGRGAGVSSDTAEFLHSIEDYLVLEVLHFLNISCVVFVLMAHHFFHWSWWTIRSAKCIINVSNVNCVNFELSLDCVLARAFDSNFFTELATHFVLINASCNAWGCCNFIQLFEVFIVDDWRLEWLFFVDPFGGHCTRRVKGGGLSAYSSGRQRGHEEFPCHSWSIFVGGHA